jgi:hypothetical protein
MSWIDKMFVRIARERRAAQHEPLRLRLSLNRGKAKGMPFAYPKTAYQERVQEDRRRRWIKRMLSE